MKKLIALAALPVVAACGSGGKAGAPAADHRGPLPLDRREVPRQLQHKPAEALIGDQQVGAGSDHADGKALLVGPPEELDQLLLGLRASEVVSRAADPDRRQARQQVVVLDPRRPP